LKWIEVAGDGGLKWVLVDRRSRVKHECQTPAKSVGTGTTLVNQPETETPPKPLPWWLND